MTAETSFLDATGMRAVCVAIARYLLLRCAFSFFLFFFSWGKIFTGKKSVESSQMRGQGKSLRNHQSRLCRFLMTKACWIRLVVVVTLVVVLAVVVELGGVHSLVLQFF